MGPGPARVGGGVCLRGRARDAISFAVRAWAHVRAAAPPTRTLDGRRPQMNCGEEIYDRIAVVRRCS